MDDSKTAKLMGNCENCYYATDVNLKNTWLESGIFYDCHRYPEPVRKERGDYCGEFTSKEAMAHDR